MTQLELIFSAPSPDLSTDYPEGWQESVQKRLDKYVHRTERCWTWTGSKSSAGYGRMNLKGTVLYAHRLSLEIACGERIPAGRHVDHLCRNPACVRPSHLEVVTPGENCRRGLTSKLTDRQVAEIRRRRGLGETTVSLAREFGINCGHVSRVARNLRRNSA